MGAGIGTVGRNRFMTKRDLSGYPGATWHDRYAAYLLSDGYRKRRQRRLDFDAGLCRLCLFEGRNTPAEQVHHLSYERLTDEHTRDLVSLCSICHKVAHTRWIRVTCKAVLSVLAAAPARKPRRPTEREQSIINHNGAQAVLAAIRQPRTERMERI
jgi:hypothetical protein